METNEAGEELDPVAVVEELAETNREDEIAENGVLEAGKQKRAGLIVGEGEEEAPDDTESDSDPVAENDVNKTEGEGASQEHHPAHSEQRLVTMEKEGTVENFLGVDRK